MPLRNHRTPEIVIQIDPQRNRRRLFTISIALSVAGVQHQIRLGPVHYFHRNPVQRHALRLAPASVTLFNRKKAELVFTDDAALVDWRRARGLKTVLVSLLGAAPPGKSRFPQPLFLPIFFHPLILTPSDYAKAARLAKNVNRPIHFLFAGNCDAESYSRKQPSAISNRHELLLAANKLKPMSIVFPKSHEELDVLLSSVQSEERLVWIDTNVMKVEQSRWLDLLSKTRYFLCAPGVAYPYCHNLNEAMACGAVPVLQFSEFYVPRLEHNKTCIAFSHPNELQDLTANLAKTEEGVWRSQSARVAQYHQDYLSLDVFYNRLKQFMDNREEFVMDWQVAGQN